MNVSTVLAPFSDAVQVTVALETQVLVKVAVTTVLADRVPDVVRLAAGEHTLPVQAQDTALPANGVATTENAVPGT